MALLREEITTSNIKREIQGLLLEQFVDVLHVVKRIVHKETQLGNDAQLIAQALSQIIAHGTSIGCNIVNHLLSTRRRKYAQINITTRVALVCSRNISPNSFWTRRSILFCRVFSISLIYSIISRHSQASPHDQL